MQTQKPNQKDDLRKQGKDVSGQSKNLNSKNESGLKRDAQDDSNVDKSNASKTPSKPSQKDR